MRPTKKQQRYTQDREFCKKLLKVDWDGCAANDYFVNLYDTSPLGRYNSKPKGEVFDSLRESATADSNLYLTIAPKAYEKNKLLTFLLELTPDSVFVPKNINDSEKYKSTYITTAKKILTKIEQGEYDFQKPGS